MLAAGHCVCSSCFFPEVTWATYVGSLESVEVAGVRSGAKHIWLHGSYVTGGIKAAAHWIRSDKDDTQTGDIVSSGSSGPRGSQIAQG